jgi:hypothetical protein
MAVIAFSRDTCRASWLAFATAPGPQILAVSEICSHHSRHDRRPAERPAGYGTASSLPPQGRAVAPANRGPGGPDFPVLAAPPASAFLLAACSVIRRASASRRSRSKSRGPGKAGPAPPWLLRLPPGLPPVTVSASARASASSPVARLPPSRPLPPHAHAAWLPRF